MNSIIFINNLHYDIAHSTQLLTEQIEKINVFVYSIPFLHCKKPYFPKTVFTSNEN